jgi:pilus assembly protein Flp/PilA
MIDFMGAELADGVGIMRTLVAQFARDERGAATAVYGLIAAAMSAAILTVISGLGPKLHMAFASLQSVLQ